MDRWGGQVIMTLGALVAAAALLGLHRVESLWAFYILWSVLGLSMAMTLYEAAFAVVVQSYSDGHRRRIGWLTVVGGMASTVFWPLSYYLNANFGWRDTVLVFAALHLLFACIPLHTRIFKQLNQKPTLEERNRSNPAIPPQTSIHRAPHAMLSACFTIYGFITAAIAVMAIAALRSRGLDAGEAVALAACIGPAQATGRALDLIFGGRLDVRRLGILTLSLLSLSFAALWLAQWIPALCVVFVFTYGLGLGLLTVVRATAPLALSGTLRYASNSAVFGGPALIARAAGPVGVVWLLEAFGGDGPVVLVLLLASALGGWLFVRGWSNTAEAA